MSPESEMFSGDICLAGKFLQTFAAKFCSCLSTEAPSQLSSKSAWAEREKADGALSKATLLGEITHIDHGRVARTPCLLCETMSFVLTADKPLACALAKLIEDSPILDVGTALKPPLFCRCHQRSKHHRQRNTIHSKLIAKCVRLRFEEESASESSGSERFCASMRSSDADASNEWSEKRL